MAPKDRENQPTIGVDDGRFGRRDAGDTPQLVELEGDTPGRRHPIVGPETVIGRDDDCTITLPDETISRRHACVRRVGDSFAIEDLGSRNGVYQNDRKCVEREAYPLAHGDSIRLAQYLFVFMQDRSPTSRHPAAPIVIDTSRVKAEVDELFRTVDLRR